MRLLSVNHLRFGRSPGGIPEHLTTDRRAFSAAAAWSRAVTLAIHEGVHAVLLSGEVIASGNDSLEPWSPLVDGLAKLQHAGIPVIGEDKLPHYPMSPDEFTRIVLDCYRMGASLLGGCCGTDPQFIAQLNQAISRTH